VLCCIQLRFVAEKEAQMAVSDIQGWIVIDNKEYASICVWSRRFGCEPLFLEIVLQRPEIKPIIGCYRGVTFRLFCQEDVQRVMNSRRSFEG
jgi:hypothetical protein